MAGFAAVKSFFQRGVLRFVSKPAGVCRFFIGPNGVGRNLTRVDIDAQNAAPTAAQFKSGLLVHTSVTGAGTLTLPTGALFEAAFPDLQVGDVVTCEYLNDGTQTVTLTGDTGMTALSAQTIATLQGRTLFIMKTGTETYDLWAA